MVLVASENSSILYLLAAKTMTELLPGCLYRLTGDKEGGHHNSYAVINDRHQSLLIDAVVPQAFSAISATKGLDNLGDQISYPAQSLLTILVGVILTHRHIPAIVGRVAIEDFRTRFGRNIPFFLTSADAQHPSCMHALPPYDKFIDPAQSSILKEFGIETIPFPGHTHGSCLFYYREKEMIFIGGGLPAIFTSASIF
jgi:glyoxylase-like metal-dependent hydrolase (beta-lactamase superfamily II)